MFVPVFLYYIIFPYTPIVGLVMAFKNFRFIDGIFGSEWAGFIHFQRFIPNGDFWKVMKNTFAISFLRILFGFPSPIIFALLLNELKFSGFKKFIQTSTYLPHFISWVVVYGIIYNFFSINGVVNQISSYFNMEPISFLAREEYFRFLYVGSAVWKEMGWSAIIYLAALSGMILNYMKLEN